jgi:hypothetical protein
VERLPWRPLQACGDDTLDDLCDSLPIELEMPRHCQQLSYIALLVQFFPLTQILTRASNWRRIKIQHSPVSLLSGPGADDRRLACRRRDRDFGKGLISCSAFQPAEAIPFDVHLPKMDVTTSIPVSRF